MDNLIKKYPLHEIFFFSGYILWVMANAFIVTIPKASFLSNIVKVIALCAWLASACVKKWKFNAFVKLAVFALLCGGVFLNTKDEALLIMVIAFFAFYKMSIYDVAKLDLRIRPICLLLTVLSYLIGLSPGNDMASTSAFLPIRYSLGYYHPNNLFSQVFAICVALLITHSAKLKRKHYFYLIVCVILFGFLTYSRTGMIVLAGTIILVMLKDTKLVKGRFGRCVTQYAFLACFVFSLVGTVLFSMGNPIFVKLNSLLTGRFNFAARLLNSRGLSFWGQDITYLSSYDVKGSSTMAVIVDNFYMNILITMGLVFTGIYLYLVTKQQKRLLCNKERILALIMVGYALYSITERPLSSMNNHLVVLLLSETITSLGRKTKLRRNTIGQQYP